MAPSSTRRCSSAEAEGGRRDRPRRRESEDRRRAQVEPDGITDRLTYGPRILISQATLEKAGLIKPGTLVRWRYAVKTSDVAASEADLVSLRHKIEAELPKPASRSPTGAIPRRR